MKIKMDIVRQAEAIIGRGDNPDLTVEDVVTEVPGVCFIRLLGIIPPQVYEGKLLGQNSLTAQLKILLTRHYILSIYFSTLIAAVSHGAIINFSKIKIYTNELTVFHVFQVTCIIFLFIFQILHFYMSK